MLLEAHIAKPMPNNSPMALGEVIRQKDHPEMRLEGDTVAGFMGVRVPRPLARPRWRP